MSLKRVRLPGRGQAPIDIAYDWIPKGAKPVSGGEWAAGFAQPRFPCHPKLMAPLVLHPAEELQVWDQACSCGPGR